MTLSDYGPAAEILAFCEQIETAPTGGRQINAMGGKTGLDDLDTFLAEELDGWLEIGIRCDQNRDIVGILPGQANHVCGDCGVHAFFHSSLKGRAATRLWAPVDFHVARLTPCPATFLPFHTGDVDARLAMKPRRCPLVVTAIRFTRRVVGGEDQHAGESKILHVDHSNSFPDKDTRQFCPVDLKRCPTLADCLGLVVVQGDLQIPEINEYLKSSRRYHRRHPGLDDCWNGHNWTGRLLCHSTPDG